MKKQIEDREGHCINCHLDFDIDEDDVKVVQEPRHGKCLVIVGSVAHSLVMGKDWQRILREREDEDHARQINRYRDPEDEDIPAEEPLVTALEDVVGLNQIPGGDVTP